MCNCDVFCTKFFCFQRDLGAFVMGFFFFKLSLLYYHIFIFAFKKILCKFLEISNCLLLFYCNFCDCFSMFMFHNIL